jgi:hypothetical protein
MLLHRLAAIALFGLACASTPPSGIMVGQWTPKSGAPQRIPISWQAIDDSQGTLHVTLGKGGEHFEGKYVRVHKDQSTATLRTAYNDWSATAPTSLDWGPEGNYSEGETIEFDDFLDRYTGKVVATLFGNRNGSMNCHLTLSVPERGLSGGGVGECRVSGGGRIDVEF